MDGFLTGDLYICCSMGSNDGYIDTRMIAVEGVEIAWGRTRSLYGDSFQGNQIRFQSRSIGTRSCYVVKFQHL